MKVLVIAATMLIPVVEFEATPQHKEMIRAKIVEYGYQCPRVVRVDTQGRSHRGDVTKIWCGDQDRTGNNIEFELTVMVDKTSTPPTLRISVIPWFGR